MDTTPISPAKRDIKRDIAVAIGFTVAAWLLAWAWPHIAQYSAVPVERRHEFAAQPLYANSLTYLVLAGVFLPLALRRKYPLVVLGVAAVLSAVYQMLPNPPAMTMIAPLISLFIVGTVRDRRTVWLAFAAVTTFTLVATVRPLSSISWVGDVISTVALFAVAASLGDAARTRRDYILAVEQRAIDAERSREEEALRRVEEERLRIARELHDITAHSLSIIAVQAGAAEKVVERDPAAALRALRTIRSTSKSSLDELRAMLGVLRGAEDAAPLSPAGRLARLSELVRTVEDAGVRVRLDVSAQLDDLPAYADVSAFRIVQEALTNVVRHAGATSATVAVRRDGDVLEVEVTDDGTGAASVGAVEGHGIRGMRERVVALGGAFEASPAASGGFRVFAHIPVPRGA